MTTTPRPASVEELPLVPISWRSARHSMDWVRTAFFGRDDKGFRMAGEADLVRFTFPRVPLWFNGVYDSIIERWSGESVMVISPRAVRELYSMSSGTAVDFEDTKKFMVMVSGSESPFLMNGPEHVAMRKAIVPEFTAKNSLQYHEMSVRLLDEMIDRLPLNIEISMADFYTRFAQELILRVVFGLEPGPELERYKRLLFDASRYYLPDHIRRIYGLMINAKVMYPKRKRPLEKLAGRPDVVPWWTSPKGNRIRLQTDTLIQAKVDELRRHPNDSVASRLIAYGDAQQPAWSEKRLRDVIATLLLAGHDTSVSAYSWVTEYLMHNDGPRELIAAEAQAGLTDRYAQAANLEATRLKSPAWGPVMTVDDDIALAGHRIRKGTWLMVLATPLHYDPVRYPDPHTYRPERFLDKDPERHGFIVFSNGRHRCPGSAFYLMEASIVLHRVFGRLELTPSLPTVDRTYMSYGFFNRPRHRTQVTVTSRKPASEVAVFRPGAVMSESREHSLLVDELGGERATCPFAGVA